VKRVAISVQKLYRGSQVLNLGHVTMTTLTLGVICHPIQILVVLNMPTKYEVSIFNLSSDIEGSNNLHIY